MNVRKYKKPRAAAEAGSFMLSMDFYAHRDPGGNWHVQNAVMGHLGQHHVHSPAGFEKWRKTTSKKCLHLSDKVFKCSCGLGPGDCREYDGEVWHGEEYA